MPDSEKIFSILITIVGSVGALFLSIIGWYIKKLIETVEKNTIELAVLNSKIESISKNNERLPKLEQDVNALHEWRRNKIKEERND